MNNENTKATHKAASGRFQYKCLIVGLLTITCVFFTACKNPVMERWWEDPKTVTPCPSPEETETGDGGGDNFGVVIFDTDGGTPQPKAIKVAYPAPGESGTIVGRLRPISKTGYGFLGWFDENDAPWDVETREVKPEDDINGDGFINLKAKWSTETRKVQFVTNNPDSKIDDQVAAYGGRIIQPVNPLPRADGYGFAGWYSDNAFVSQWDFVNGTVTSNVTLYAKWSSDASTINFNANGGTRPDGITELTHVQTISISYGYIQDPGPLVKEGHSFGGWYADSGFAGQPWNYTTDKVTQTHPNPLTLYAKWVPNIYLVNFIITPSTARIPDTQSVAHGEKIVYPGNLPQLPNGRIFDGWYTSNGEEWNFNNPVTGSMTLYANWAAPIPGPEPDPGDIGGSGDNFGVIVFDTAGGTPQPKAVKIEWGGSVGRLQPISRLNYGFAGWFDENTPPVEWDIETHKVQPEDDVDGDGFITLTARWSQTFYIVCFVTNNPDEVIADQRVADGSRITQPVNPQRDGYGFAGWFTENTYNYQWNFATYPVEASDVDNNNTLTLYAKWESDTRIIHFNTNGGTLPDNNAGLAASQTISMSYGYIQDPGTLAKEGHSFGGWYTDSGFVGQPWNFATKKVTDSDVPQVNPLTLYAKWVPNIYLVNFAITPSTARAPDTQSVAHGGKVVYPGSLPQLANGKFFGGWCIANEETWNFNDPVTSSITLYAIWVTPTPGPAPEPGPDPGASGDNFGVVVFDTVGGIPQPKAVKVEWGGTVGRLRPISRTGYGFIGWIDETGYPWDVETHEVKPEDDVDGDGFITLTIRWSQNTHMVLFVTNASDVIDGQWVADGGKITQPVMPEHGPTGYGFAGWYPDSHFAGSPWDFANGVVVSDITLYANWLLNTCKVSFNANGGTRPDGITILTHTQTIALDYGYIQDPGLLIKTGYAFGGWYEDSGFTGSPWDFATDKVTQAGSLTLYAKWVPNVYLVDFVISPSTAAVPETQSVIHNEKVVHPGNLPQLANGSYFGGWYTASNDEWHFNTPVTTNMTLYAKWIALPPVPDPGPGPDPGESGNNFGVVFFNTDGGTPQPQAVKIEWGNTVGRLPPISKTGFGFVGWVDETGALWDIETRTVNLEDDVNGDGIIAIKAAWSQTFYTVCFETNSDAFIDDQRVAANSRITQPANPPQRSSDNFGFAGWYKDAALEYKWDFSTDYVNAIDVDSNNVLTLYAKWDDTTPRTVNFEANGGTLPDGITPFEPTEVKVSKNYDYIQDPGPLAKTGYSFGGWYKENTYANQWDFAKTIISQYGYDVPSLTLYAKWIQNIYIVNFEASPSATVIASQQIIHGGAIAKPNDPQSGDGRAFGGWYTENTCVNQWDFDSGTVTTSMTLYARWMVQTRTVRFEVNGGNDWSRTDFTILIGNKIINPGSPVRPGYTFKGWFFDPACTPGNGINFTSYTVTAPDTVIGMDPLYLYAGWTPSSYYIRFNIEGIGKVAERYVQHGERVDEPDMPLNPGHVLHGWYTDTSYTTSWNFDTGIVTSSRDLYAKWVPTEYIVRFHLGTGEGTSAGKIPQTNQPGNVQHLHLNDTVVEPHMPANPDASGWSFLRWDYKPNPAANDPDNIDDTTWRNTHLQAWDFNQSVNVTVTVQEGDNRVLNLYARWVPPAPDMIWVPVGSFTMGDSGVSGTPAAYHAYPTRRVTVDGFYIGRYEVTQLSTPDTNKSYTDVMGVNPSQFYRNDVRPVDRVSWFDAIEYCNRLTDSEMGASEKVYTISGGTLGPNLAGTGGVRPAAQSIISANVTADFTKHGYRLPTEAEWEYAARGGNNSPGNFAYSGSNDPTLVAWYNETIKQGADTGSTQTVGTKNANALGIFDMSGNITEWVWDWFASYKDSYYSTAPAGDNPTGPATGTERIRRGGGWSNAVGNVRSVMRNSQAPGDATWVNGFRVVRGPGEMW